MITTVVFDLDDTLYDEIEYCKSGLLAAANFLSNRPGSPTSEQIQNSLWKQFTAGNRTQTFNAALDELKIPYDENLIIEMVKVYRGHKPDIKLPQDSNEKLSKAYPILSLSRIRRL